MELIYDLSLVALLIVSALMILLVLMQKPKQEGLGAAFGGGMTNEMFGAHTVTVLQKGSAGLAVIFFVLLIVIASVGSSLQAQKNHSGDDQPSLEEYQDLAGETGAGATAAGLVNEVPTDPAAGLVAGSVETESDADTEEATAENAASPADSGDAASQEAATEEGSSGSSEEIAPESGL